MAYVPRAVRRRVETAARDRCGYCLTPQQISGAPLHVDHIVPVAGGGTSDEGNLWLACAWCNSYKGARTSAVDPESGIEHPLFNPRLQRWEDHFCWSEEGTIILGLTPTGRATVALLHMNNDYIVAARRQWVLAGWHPPSLETYG
jgi:hypothetical protein